MKTVTITMVGGVIQDIDVPEGVLVVVKEYDLEEDDYEVCVEHVDGRKLNVAGFLIGKDEVSGEQYLQSEWEHGKEDPHG